MELRQANPRKQGDIGEAIAAAWLAQAGFDLFMPFGTNPNTDLVAEYDGRLFRIQVKTCTCWERQRWSVALCTRGGNQSWNGIVKYFSPSRCDFVFVLTGDMRRWFIPAAAIDATTAIQLGGPKYAEYEVTGMTTVPETPHLPGFDGSLRSASLPRGSAEVGESGRPVKPLAMPEWVRIPPPPSEPGKTQPYCRTTVSPGHQITIPSTPFREAELEAGDKLIVEADGPGRVVARRIEIAEN